MLPIDVLRANKNIGAFKMEGNNPFFTLPLTIDGKPIKVQVQGTPVEEDVFSIDQWGKLKVALDISEDGAALLMASSLQQTLKNALEQETLPDLKLVVKSMVYNERMYVTWPTERKKFVGVELLKGNNGTEELKFEDEKKMQEVRDIIKSKKKTGFEVELYCWARRDEEKHELVIGITPRLRAIEL